MISEVKKAVIVAAGLGTRFLPITKSFPKEMLPLIDKPVLQYIIEEVVNSGIKEIILVISPEKELIKDYFRQNKKLEYFLKVRGKNNYLKEVKKTHQLAHLTYCYQKSPLGIADAILCAKNKIQNQPFALLFADDVIYSKTPCLKQLIKVYNKNHHSVVAVTPVSFKEISHYGVVKLKNKKNKSSLVLDLIEKPKTKEAPSNLAIVGRYILLPPILEILEKLKTKKLKPGEEIYLTDALRILLQKKYPINVCNYDGEWLSCGNKIGWLLANLKLGRFHPETKKELKNYLLRTTKNLRKYEK